MHETRDPVTVMYVMSPNGTEGAGEAFDRLEASLPSLKGRKFYGTMLNGEYRACVALEPQDRPAAMGLDTWTIPGGAYVRRKLPDWPEHVAEIGQIFGTLRRQIRLHNHNLDVRMISDTRNRWRNLMI